MKRNLNQLADAVARILVGQFGFSRNKLRFNRDDALTRVAWIVPGKNASSALYPFELILDLGMPALSTMATNAQPWVVRASAEKVYRKMTPAPRVKFVFRDGNYDEAVEGAVLEAVHAVCGAFLLKLESPEALYQFVRRNALEFFQLGMAAENEFKQLDLMPWNVVPRMQLAAVYAASLGRSDDAIELERELVAYAVRNRMEHFLSGIRESIASALEIGR